MTLQSVSVTEEEAFPRLLFVTPCAFNRVTGSGITFGNLFRAWPRDRLATAHNDVVPVTTDVCENYYHLSTKEISRWGPLKFISNLTQAKSPSATSTDIADRGHRLTGLRTLKQLVAQLVFGASLPHSGRLSSELSSWIAEFKPDLLYSILGSNSMMELVEQIHREFDLPLVIHMMDDWPAARYRGALLSWWQRRKMQRLLNHLISVAKVRLAICDYMSEAYQERYKVPFLSFQNAMDTDRWGAYAKKDLSIGRRIRLLYVGSIYLNAQLDSLLDCCYAVAALRKEGIPITFTIYSPSFLSEQFRHRLVVDSSIVLQDTITEDERYFSELADAAILVLPVNFDKTTVRYIRYSMPTKVPAYLASGTPILVYGPQSVAQVRYALEEEWGYVVSQKGINHVMNGILKILQDWTLRHELSSAARKTAARSHDINRVRQRFQSALRSATR